MINKAGNNKFIGVCVLFPNDGQRDSRKSTYLNNSKHKKVRSIRLNRQCRHLLHYVSNILCTSRVCIQRFHSNPLLLCKILSKINGHRLFIDIVRLSKLIWSSLAVNTMSTLPCENEFCQLFYTDQNTVLMQKIEMLVVTTASVLFISLLSNC